jgi:hypothetical protein
VVRPEDIHDEVEAAPEFFPVVGDIRQPVRRLSRTLDDDAVLFESDTVLDRQPRRLQARSFTELGDDLGDLAL